MRLAWVCGAPLVRSPEGATSRAATVRLRVLSPAEELRRRGHEVALIESDRPLDGRSRDALRAADCVVFSKLVRESDGSFGEAARRYREILEALAESQRVVMDVNDDNFSALVFRNFYVDAAPRVQAWTTATATMAEVLARHVGAAARVIGEPFEGPEGAPKAPPQLRASALGRLLGRAGRAEAGTVLKVLWFGHNANKGTFEGAIPEVKAFARRLPVELACVSTPNAGMEKMCERAHRPEEGFVARFVPWSLEAQWRELAASDLVVLPSDAELGLKRVKSANRMVESLRAGRLAVAHPLPSYQDLAAYGWVGERLAEGIEWALSHGDEAVQRVSRGQAFVARAYSPAAIAEAWLGVLHG